MMQLPGRVANRAETSDFRFGLLVAATAMGVYLVSVTELLSVLGRLTALYVAVAWVIPAVIGVWLALHVVRRRVARPPWPIGALGAGPLGQALGATIFVTAPMAILQGSSTQNDLVATFWIVVVVVAALDSPRDRWFRCLLGGGAVGLALLTKGTAWILLAPFVIW